MVVSMARTLAAPAAPLFANPTTTVFINEFHYDDAGTDANEFIEVAAPAGTNMANYSLVLYNGNGGAVYNTTALSGTTTNQQGGYGFVSITYPVDGIQNGSPDGIALVNTSTNTLVQFLCYEGTFAGVGGPAAGVTCTDVGVAENGSAEGASLQLQGTGTTYGDFTWIARNSLNANTKNAVNTGQTFTGGGGGVTLSINDVSQAEGNAGTTVFTFTVSLSSTTHGGVTFDIATADGTATAASGDYVAKSLTGQSIPNGSDTYTFTVDVNGDTDPEPNETFFVNVTNVSGATATDGQGQGTIQNDDVTVTSICQIQGGGTTSSIPNGTNVSTTGIVTAVKQGSSGGFFIQQSACDADPNTSDGIFVFTGSSVPAGVVVGNEVLVSGNLVEFVPGADPNQNPITELSGGPVTVTVVNTAQPLPTPVVLTPAETTAPSETTDPLDTLEEYEGMRVSVPSMTVVAPTQGNINEPSATATTNGVFYGVVTGVSRPFREPGISISDPLPPGAPANVPRFDENPERLRVDSDSQPGTTPVDVPSGTVILSVTGPLDYGFRTYTILPDATLAPTPPLPTARPVPDPTATEYTVASFNLFRFFDTVNDPGVGEPVLTPAAFAKRLDKTSLVIRTVTKSPDVIGVQEAENLSTLQTLANEVNNDTVAGGFANPNYQAFLVEGNDPGGIDVGFLVKTSRVTVIDVTQEGKTTTYTEPGGGTALLNDRPPLVLRATVARPGGGTEAFTVIVNHLRSFLGIDDPADGARVREKRRKQAEFLANLIQTRQTNDPSERISSVGDYNAFQFNDGYVDVIGTIKGQPAPPDQVVLASSDLVNPDLTDLVDTLPAAERYSYTFDGNAQVLDHIIINDDAQARLNRFAYARNDADFPEVYYTDGTRPERTSDHDMPVAYFSLTTAAQAGQLIISEFRFRGPGFEVGEAAPKSAGFKASKPVLSLGAASPAENDEFIEFYNNTDSTLVVSTTDGSAGWSLVASDGAVRFVIPNGTVIPARRHYLATNSDGYSLSNYPAGNDGTFETTATGDIEYSGDIQDLSGIALFRTANPAGFTLDNRLDAVGYSTADSLYREGAGFNAGSPGAEVGGNIEYSFYRDLLSSRPKDTGDNVADFRPVETSGIPTTIGTRLGAPGPENLSSPVVKSPATQILSRLLDPAASSSASPNRVRNSSSYTDTLSGTGTYPLGTFSIRRTFVNNTGAPVNRLRFRITDITTFPSPPGTADLRAITSADIDVTLTNGSTVPVQGTVLEEPPIQAVGGGMNTSLSPTGTINLESPLPAGASINVQFLLGVRQSGGFRFFFVIEALP